MATNNYKGRSNHFQNDELPAEVQEITNDATRAPDVIYALLRDAYYRGPVGVGKGGTRRVYGGGSPGTGLRRPHGPLYDMPESWRVGILSRALDAGLIVRVDDGDEDDLDAGTYAATEFGRDVLLDADRCGDCGRVRRPYVLVTTVELSRYSSTKNASLVTACPDCEATSAKYRELELGDDPDDSHYGRDDLSRRLRVNENVADACVFTGDLSEHEQRDPSDEEAEENVEEAEAERAELLDSLDEGDRVRADGEEWTVVGFHNGQVSVSRPLDDGRDLGQAFPVEEVERLDDEEPADGDDEDDEPEDATYALGQEVRVADSEDAHSEEEGEVVYHKTDGDDVRYVVEFDDGTRSTYDADPLSTMRPVAPKQEEPEGPEFEDDRPRGDDEDACPPEEVVASELDAVEEAVRKATAEGVEDAAGDDNINYLLEGDVDVLRRVYDVVDRLNYVYVPVALYEPLDDEEDEGLLLVRVKAPEWVAPDTPRGVYVCSGCGAGEVRDAPANLVLSELPSRDAPRGFRVVEETEVHGEEAVLVACEDCGETGILGTDTSPWTCGSPLSPTVHRTPPKFRK